MTATVINHSDLAVRRVFVSQLWPTSQAVDWATRFAASLRRHDLHVFAEWAISGNPSSDEVERELRESDLIVVLMGPDGINNPTFSFEYGAAIGLGKRFLAVLPEDISPSSLPGALRHDGYLRRTDPETTAERLIARLAGE
jgi:hypothetical protein